MRNIFTLFLLPALIISSALYAAMPLSSFFIKPEMFNNKVYKQNESVFSISSSDEGFTLPRTSNQKVLSESSRAGMKEIQVSTGVYPVNDRPVISKYLRDTPYLNLQTSEIKNTAKRFTKSKDPVNDISRFVYNHITDKKEGIPLIPALSILRDRAGDCTEHSILTVSLLRAAGIPSMAVVGIILTEKFAGEDDVFVYHMWAEAYIKGKWILVDSTRPGSFHHNRYIAFTFHNLTTESPLEYLNAISAINNIRIKQISQ